MTAPTAVLIGPPAAGKSRIGKRVARILGVPFTDTDSQIVAAHGKIADIFAEHGEPHFRALEREAVRAALAGPGVVSLGGGAVLDLDTQADLRKLPVVLLTASADAVRKRIRGGKRPLLASGGIDAWERLVAERTPIYEALATRVWDTSSRPVDQLAAEIADWLASRAGSDGSGRGASE
ncbi:shikimate kinase [Lysobacter korlensis]|uniref:Shikimate kinase n=1 Tax=Lysobacter korlensis TaxID=553636 RepID=A0ABV6RM17_9GAMM